MNNSNRFLGYAVVYFKESSGITLAMIQAGMFCTVPFYAALQNYIHQSPSPIIEASILGFRV